MLKVYMLFLAVTFSIQSNSAQALTGHSEDIYILLEVPKTVVASWLPPRLQLAEVDGDTYPVYMNYGKQRGVAVLPPYLEISVKVPRVSFNDQESREFNYYKILYMNNYQAVYWGIALYDTPKEFAYMGMDATKVWVEDEDTRARTFETTYSASATDNISIDHPHVQSVMDWIDHDAMTFRNGRYRCWTGTRDIEKIVPVRAQVTMYEGFVEGAPEVSQTYHGVDEGPMGSFMMESDWTFNETSCD